MNTKKSTNSDNFSQLNRDFLTQNYYQQIVAYDLILKQNYTSIMQLPHLEKIVLNTTSKIYVNDRKFVVFTLAALELLSGQKPQLTYARKSIANFKIREHQILGCRVVLRENQMYNFLDKLTKIIFPRIRESSFFFLGKKESKTSQLTQKNLLNNQPLNEKSTGLSAFTIGFNNLMIFPELENHYQLVDYFRGLNVTFVFSNSTKATNLLVLSGFQVPLFQ